MPLNRISPADMQTLFSAKMLLSSYEGTPIYEDVENQKENGPDPLGGRKPGRLKLSTGIAEFVLWASLGLMCGGQTGKREGGGSRKELVPQCRAWAGG